MDDDDGSKIALYIFVNNNDNFNITSNDFFEFSDSNDSLDSMVLKLDEERRLVDKNNFEIMLNMNSSQCSISKENNLENLIEDSVKNESLHESPTAKSSKNKLLAESPHVTLSKNLSKIESLDNPLSEMDNKNTIIQRPLIKDSFKIESLHESLNENSSKTESSIKISQKIVSPENQDNLLIQESFKIQTLHKYFPKTESSHDTLIKNSTKTAVHDKSQIEISTERENLHYPQNEQISKNEFLNEHLSKTETPHKTPIKDTIKNRKVNLEVESNVRHKTYFPVKRSKSKLSPILDEMKDLSNNVENTKCLRRKSTGSSKIMVDSTKCNMGFDERHLVDKLNNLTSPTSHQPLDVNDYGGITNQVCDRPLSPAELINNFPKNICSYQSSIEKPSDYLLNTVKVTNSNAESTKKSNSVSLPLDFMPDNVKDLTTTQIVCLDTTEAVKDINYEMQNLMDTSENVIESSHDAMDTPRYIKDTSINTTDTSLDAMDTLRSVKDISLDAMDTSEYITDTPNNVIDTMDTREYVKDATFMDKSKENKLRDKLGLKTENCFVPKLLKSCDTFDYYYTHYNDKITSVNTHECLQNIIVLLEVILMSRKYLSFLGQAIELLLKEAKRSYLDKNSEINFIWYNKSTQSLFKMCKYILNRESKGKMADIVNVINLSLNALCKLLNYCEAISESKLKINILANGTKGFEENEISKFLIDFLEYKCLPKPNLEEFASICYKVRNYNDKVNFEQNSIDLNHILQNSQANTQYNFFGAQANTQFNSFGAQTNTQYNSFDALCKTKLAQYGNIIPEDVKNHENKNINNVPKHKNTVINKHVENINSEYKNYENIISEQTAFVENIGIINKNKNVENIGDINKDENVENIGNINKHKNVENIGNINKNKNVENIGNINKHKNVENIGNINKNKNVENIGIIYRNQNVNIDNINQNKNVENIGNINKNKNVENIGNINKNQNVENIGIINRNQNVNIDNINKNKNVENIGNINKNKNVENIGNINKNQNVENIGIINRNQNVNIDNINKNKYVENIVDINKDKNVDNIGNINQNKNVENIRVINKNKNVENIVDINKNQNVENIGNNDKGKKGENVPERKNLENMVDNSFPEQKNLEFISENKTVESIPEPITMNTQSLPVVKTISKEEVEKLVSNYHFFDQETQMAIKGYLLELCQIQQTSDYATNMLKSINGQTTS